jgi:peptidyl-prolyl cis-trans isomerase D
MEIFRKLAHNIFFKIFLGLVALSFVMFGVSGFILGNSNTWVAKIGSKTISLNTFNNAARSDREIILSSANSPQAMQYLESQQFKSDVLARLVNRIMIENIKEDFAISASKKIIFNAIAKDPSFKDENGKFNREKFTNFLTKNGLTEARYIGEIENEIISTMALQTLAMNVALNYQEIVERENFRQEKRVADIITISKNNVKNVNISAKDLEEFFAQNKHHYKSKEMRKISYVTFSKNNFAGDMKISEAEIASEYEKNKANLMEPELRSFYQIVFDKKEQATDFVAKLKAAEKSQIKNQFAKLALEMKGKNLKAISIDNARKSDMLDVISYPVFELKLNEVSALIESPLGFHVVLLNDIIAAKPMSLAKAKESIKLSLLEGREEKVLQEKISQIDEAVLANNSLEKLAQKFGFGAVKTMTLEQLANSQEIENLIGISDSAFALKEGGVSKILYTKSGGFYLFKVDKIIPSREKTLAEVEGQLHQDLIKEKSVKGLKDLAAEVAAKVKANPEKAAEIAAKYQVKFAKNSEVARISYLKMQGRNIPFQSRLAENVFALNVNEVSDAIVQNENEFVVAHLREIKAGAANPAQIQQAQNSAIEEFRNEIMSNYNSYLLKKYPVKINEEIFGKNEEKSEAQ